MSEFTKGPWELSYTASKGRLGMIHAAIADQNWGTRGSVISPNLDKLECWVKTNDENGE